MACLCQRIAGEDMALASVCLGELWIFDNLDPEELKALMQEATRKKLSKGQNLFTQGNPADQMFLIKGGRIKLSKILKNGNELTLDIRKAGDFLGENMFAEESIYPVSAYCLEDSMICGFTRARFEQLILKHPNIGLQIVKNLSQRISNLTTHVGSLAVSNIEDRLYRVLSNVAREHGAESPRGIVIQFPLTHEELGFLTGAHRVSISRAMKTLKQAGKIIHEDRQLILPTLQTA